MSQSKRTLSTALFAFITNCENVKLNLEIFNISVYIIYIVINYIAFLSLKEVSAIGLSQLLSSGVIFIVGAAIIGILLVEIFISIIYQLNLYLIIQLSAFRFILLPIAYICLFQQIVTPVNLPVIISVILVIMLSAFGLFISATIVHSSVRKKELYAREHPITCFLLIFEVFFYSYDCFSDSSFQIVAITLMGSVSFVNYFTHFKYLRDESVSLKLLSFANVSQILIWSALVIAYFRLNIHLKSLVYCSLVFYIFAFVFSWLKTKKYHNYELLFNSKITSGQLIEIVESLIFQIQHLNDNAQLSFGETNLLAFLHLHEEQCSVPNCQLAHQSTAEEIKTIHDSKSRKLLLHKIVKKIEYFLDDYHKSNLESFEVKMAFLHFYLKYLPNKTRIMELLSDIDIEHLSWADQLKLYKIKEGSLNINSIQSIEYIKIDEELLQFQNVLFSVLTNIMEFWSQFYDQRIDLSQLMVISQKIFPLKIQMQSIVKKLSMEDKFVSLKIMRLYERYMRKILHQQNKADELWSYINILAKKLREAKEIKFISTETEIGIIVISLSEYSLGNIFMVNNKACHMFNYKKKEFQSIKVNAIMPIMFAVRHDEILSNFLKNKSKKLNTDERLLIGKNKSGFIFPLKLQLQKVSYTANDEYIFIANLKVQKLKEAPIYCIVDAQGEIKDYTSSFKLLFSRGSSSGLKNIQQIIPEYFQQSQEEGEITQKIFSQNIKHDKYGQFDLKFTVNPVQIRGKHAGFLIKIDKKMKRSDVNVASVSYSQQLKAYYSKQAREVHLLTYHPGKNIYQFEKAHNHLHFRRNLSQVTIPFLNFSHLSNIVQYNENKQNYNQDIRTIRLVYDHFQRIQDESMSFSSEVYSEEEHKLDLRGKIQQIKQSIVDKSEVSSLSSFKIAIRVLLCIIIILLIILIYFYYQNVSQQNNNLDLLQYNQIIIGKLSEYIIYFQANTGMNQTAYQADLQQMKNALIRTVEEAGISQMQKESILKIIYLQEHSNLTALLTYSTLNFSLESQSNSGAIVMMWWIVVGFILLLTILQCIIVYFHKQSLYDIYTIFLEVKDKEMKRIYQDCRNLMNQIQKETAVVDKERDSNSLFNQFDGEEEQNQLEKVKQFKNTSRSKDTIYIVQMITPLVVLLGFTIGSLVAYTMSYSSYSNNRSLIEQIANVHPSSSLAFMEIFLNSTKGLQIAIPNTYKDTVQSLSLTINQLQDGIGQYSFIDVLMGNVCLPVYYSDATMLQQCPIINNKVLTFGVTRAMNYILTELIHDSYNAVNSSSQSGKYVQLIQLQFKYLQPVLLITTTQMMNTLHKEITNMRSTYTVLAGIAMMMLLFFDIYLMLYPFEQMEKEIAFTKDLVQMMPTQSEESKIK